MSLEGTKEDIWLLSHLFLSWTWRGSTGFPRRSERQAVHQRGLQVQCGQALRHPLHWVSVHEWLHGAEAIFRFVFVMLLQLKSPPPPIRSFTCLSCHPLMQMWSTTHGRKRKLGTRPERSCTPSLCPIHWPLRQPQLQRHKYSWLSCIRHISHIFLKSDVTLRHTLYPLCFTRLCIKPVRRVSVTSSMLRSSHMTCPTTITSTLSTATCSPGWPRTSVGYGKWLIVRCTPHTPHTHLGNEMEQYIE